MSFGLRIENPAGTLVVDSGVTHYRFLGKPAPYASGSMTAEALLPVTYRVDISPTGMPPVVFIRPEAGKVSAVKSVVHLGGGTWEIAVYSVDISGGWAEDMRDTPVATPSIYVFTPMGASGDSYGLQLTNAAGQVSFDTGFKPLWIRGAASFPSRSGGKNAGGPWSTGGAAFFNGDTQAVSDVSTALVMGSCMGSGEASISEISEPTDRWAYGWSVVSGALARHRFFEMTFRDYHTLDFSTDDVFYDLAACPVVIARTTDYD